MSAISFFIVLQFRNLRDLFLHGGGDTNAADADELLSFVISSRSHGNNDVVVVPPSSSSSVLDVPWGGVEPNNSSQRIASYNNNHQTKKKKKNVRTRRQKKKLQTTSLPSNEPTADNNNNNNNNNTADKEEEDPVVDEGGIVIKEREQEQKKAANNAAAVVHQYYLDMDPLSWTLPQATPIRNQTSEEFMLHYIATKRRHNISLPWDNDNDDDDDDNQQIYYNNRVNPKVSLPLPIINLNFPKSATLTMSAYFDCAGLTSVHTSTQSGRIAICMLQNQLHNNPPMHNCDRHRPNRHSSSSRSSSSAGRHHIDVNSSSSVLPNIIPIDFFSDIGVQGPPCYYASLHDGGLENIVRHYPNATILLATRDASSWYHSMSKWGGIMMRWKKYCGFDGHYLHTTTTTNNNNTNIEYWRNMFDTTVRSREKEEMYWINFYHAHTQKIREFALSHLSMTYVEVEIENPNIGSILQQYTKVSPDCVLYCHPGPHWIKKHNTITKCHPIGQEPALLKEGEIWPGGDTKQNHGEEETEAILDII